MKYTIAILIILLSGCVTSKRCFEKFPPPSPDTVHTSFIEWRDTIVYIKLLGEIVYDSVIIEKFTKIPIKIPYTSLYAETDFSEARASVENNKLKLELKQRDSLLAIYLEDAIKESRDTITIIKPFVKEVPVKTKWQDFLGYGFWIFLGLFLFTLLFLILRK